MPVNDSAEWQCRPWLLLTQGDQGGRPVALAVQCHRFPTRSPLIRRAISGELPVAPRPPPPPLSGRCHRRRDPLLLSADKKVRQAPCRHRS
jgi:hypothetical protein